MNTGLWVKEFPGEVMVCDSSGIILEMNDQAESLFAEDGGRELLGTNVLECHPDPAYEQVGGHAESSAL